MKTQMSNKELTILTSFLLESYDNLQYAHQAYFQTSFFTLYGLQISYFIYIKRQKIIVYYKINQIMNFEMKKQWYNIYIEIL